MRKRHWWLGVGTVVAGAALGMVGQRGWSQSGDAPLSRPNTLPLVEKGSPPPTRPVVTTPSSAPMDAQLPPTVLPPPTQPAPPMDVKLPPKSYAPLQEPTAPSRFRVNETSELSSPRFDQPTTVTPSTNDVTATKQEPVVSVEWIGPATAQLNQPHACHIVVRNTGQAAVHQVTVRHRLNPGVTCKRTEPVASVDRDDLVWTVGTLQPGQQRRLELQIVASQRGPMNCQATVTFAATAGQQVQVREPLLAIKMRAPEKAILGENVNLLFAVTNPGDGVAELVKVKALLPEGLECSRGRTFEMEIGNLAPKESRTLQIACTAKSSGGHKSMIVASAEGNLSASDHGMTEILEAKLDLVVQGPKLRFIDRHAVYQIKVINPGSAPAQNVMLSELVPAGFKFHSATGGGRWDEGTKTVSWQIGDVPPGQSREVSIDLLAVSVGEYRLQANVATNRGVRSEASAHTRIEGSSALIIELVDVDDPVEVGGEAAYEIRITNAGTKMETNVELACTLPNGVEFKGAKSIAGIRHRVEGREVVFEPLPRLAPKADVIYRVTVRGQQAGDVRFRTRVRADGMPEPVIREESTRFYDDR